MLLVDRETDAQTDGQSTGQTKLLNPAVRAHGRRGVIKTLGSRHLGLKIIRDCVS